MKMNPAKAARPAEPFFSMAFGNAIMSGEEISMPAAKHMKYSSVFSAQRLFFQMTKIPTELTSRALIANSRIHKKVFWLLITFPQNRE